MAAFVLDASVAIAGLSPDEASSSSAALIARCAQEGAVAPAIWFYEVANIAVLKLQRGVLTPEQYAILSAAFAKMRIERDVAGLQAQCEAASVLALRHTLTVYDAAYLELALRLKLPLATLDQELVRAARAAGVAVLP